MLLRVNSVSMDTFISWTQFTFLHSFLLTLYKMDRDFQVFKTKIWKVTNYMRDWNVHFSIASTGFKLHVACTLLSNSCLLTKACTFSALTDNLLWQLEGDNRPDVTAVRDSTTEKERKIKLITILLPLHAHDDGKNYVKYCKKKMDHSFYLKIGVWLAKRLH